MKTLTLAIMIVLCLLFFKSKAQNYFNNRYDLFGKADASANVFMFNNQYFVSAGGLNPPQTELSLSVLKLDLNGIQLKYTHDFITNNFFYSTLSKGTVKINDSVLCTTGFRTNASASYGYLYWYKTNLDSIKYKEYGYSNKINFIYTQLLYANKYHYLIGSTDSLYTNQNILLIKTDTVGNEIWKKKIGIVGMDENAYSIDTLQGQLIIAGNRVVHGTSSTDGFVMRLDTSGNIVWQKIVNTNAGYGVCKALTLKDGNVLVYNRLKMYDAGSITYNRFLIQKITPNNTLLWQKTYNASNAEADCIVAIENTQGNIVIAGQKGATDYSCVGTVNILNQNGDSLFYKEFYKELGSQNYFRDVIQTTDKGYCFAGFLIPVFANGGTGTEDIWLLKVDSNFCESALPCGSVVGISEHEVIEGGLKIYPNPAANELYFVCNFDNAITLKIHLYDLSGRLLKEETLINTKKTQKIDLQDLMSGVYIYKIIEGNTIIKTSKIIILK